MHLAGNVTVVVFGMFRRAPLLGRSFLDYALGFKQLARRLGFEVSDCYSHCTVHARDQS